MAIGLPFTPVEITADNPDTESITEKIRRHILVEKERRSIGRTGERDDRRRFVDANAEDVGGFAIACGVHRKVT